jgi:hypothetical protein
MVAIAYAIEGGSALRDILQLVNRRLRLVLILAALVAAGPTASARVLDTAGSQVSITWVRADRTDRVQVLETAPALRVFGSPAPGVIGRDAIVRDTVLRHSLFQRPPPFLS